jgi:replication factor A2
MTDGNYGNYGNYSTTNYSAQGGAGGGGFMPVNSQNSPSGGSVRLDDEYQTRRRSADIFVQGVRNDSLRPVTIKQLIEAESPDNTEFKIDGSSISQVCF